MSSTLQKLVSLTPGFTSTIILMPVGEEVTITVTPTANLSSKTTKALPPFSGTYPINEELDHAFITDMTSIFDSDIVKRDVTSYLKTLQQATTKVENKSVQEPPKAAAKPAGTLADKKADKGKPTAGTTIAPPPAPASPNLSEVVQSAIVHPAPDQSSAELVAEEPEKQSGSDADFDW